MSTTTFYDMLGVAGAPSPRDAAADMWPSHSVQGTTGKLEQPDITQTRLLMEFLQGVLTFRNMRPGADNERVGFTADLVVGSTPLQLPLVLATMPDVEFRLRPTPTSPARVTLTAGPLGTELVVDALPVEIRLPQGFLVPLEPPNAPSIPSTTEINSFVSGHHDTLSVVLNSAQPSSILVHVKIRMTEDGRFVVEPAVPVSVGPCRFLGLPCRAIHDLNLFPSPLLGVGPEEEKHWGAQALEWTRHPLLDAEDGGASAFTVRSVDLDDTRTPFSDIVKFLNPDGAAARRFEWVIEDLALPVGAGPLALASHFEFGLRRKLEPGDDPGGAYNLGGLAIPLKGPARILQFKYLVIEQLLFRSVPSPELAPTEADRQWAFFKLALVNDPAGAGHGATIEFTDESTLLVGWRYQPGVQLFKLFGATFSLLGARAGLSFQRMAKDKGVFDSGVLVGDLSVVMAPKSQSGQSSAGVCKLEGESAEPKGVVVHDFGVRFGEFQLGSFWQTGGAKLKAFDIIPLEIEEFGLITEPSGAVYFGFSGSIPLPAGCDAGTPVSSAQGTQSTGKVENGVGFRFYRLRGKVAGAEEAPALLIDGIGLSIRYNKIGITGFGTLSEYVIADHRYKECGLSVEVRFPAAGTEIVLGGLFFRGTVRGPVQNFSYGMVGLHVSPIPIGAVTLSDVRLLFAWNMVPNLGPAQTGAAPGMRLFNWYKSNASALSLPSNRNLGAGGWKPLDESYTIAAAAKVAIGKPVTISAFFMYFKSDEGKGLLAGLEIFLFKPKKAIGYAVVEMDGDRWTVLAGLSIGPANVIGKPVPLLSDSVSLTGTFYHTNKPSTTAIGQFHDPSTWLALQIGRGKGKKFDLFSIELYAGICIQSVDLPEGPNVFAMRLSVTGGSRLFKVGGITYYLTLGLVAGTWRTESKVSGFMVYLEGGIEIDVFWVFNFGASIRVECDYLGPDPVFRRFSCEIKIHTPWWLPDVTWRWSRTLGAPTVQQLQVIGTPVIEASAKQLSVAEPVPLHALSPVAGTTIDPAAVYNINELAAANGNIPAESIAKIVPISIDSSLSLHFKSSVNDRLVFGQNTLPGLGGDGSNEVKTSYDLVELGIRRRPLTTGSAWSNLIDPSHSRVESLVGLPPDVVQQRMRSKLRFRWDADFQREGKPDARRLLINTDAPYWFTVLNLEGDESLVQNSPGWPCCPGDDHQVVWHAIDYKLAPAGRRVPRTQRFTNSRSTLRWVGILPPIAGPGQGTNVPSVARLNGDFTPEGTFGRLTFVETARIVELYVGWKPMALERQLVVRAFHGLKLLEEKVYQLSQIHPHRIVFDRPEGISEILLSLRGRPVNQPGTDFGWIEWNEFRFRSVAEVQQHELEEGRCDATQETSARPGGRFAWLPDHEYELSFKTRVTVRHERAGELVREVPQKVLFRTKGVPGLNRTDRVGQEFDPYVEATYPGPARMLYRCEPVVLALNERSDIFRLPQPQPPDDPAERRQKVDWVLVVHQVGGAGSAERISQPATDWIVSHRGTAPTPRPRVPVDAQQATQVLLRQVPSLDLQWQRFETVLASASSCGTQPEPPFSRVLLHQPHDPGVPNATPALWPARAILRAAAQIKNGPWVDRTPFEAGDQTSLLTTAAWNVVDSAIGPATDTGTVTSLAIFGDPDWRHFEAALEVDPGTGKAGVAAAVTGNNAVLFLIDGQAKRLQMVRRQAGVETELASAALSADLQAPYLLEVTAYNDAWQASVGSAQVSQPRGVTETGKLALAVRGAGRIRSLRVDPLDAYRFDFITSRYVDFAAHIGSCSGKIALLPQVADPGPSLERLLASTDLNTIMKPGADPAERQRAFDEWTAKLGVPLRREVSRLELSMRSLDGRVDLLLIESPEPLPFSEDVRLNMIHLQTKDRLRLAILSDGTESRAYVVPVSETGEPMIFEPGDYELIWSVIRNRYRGTGVDPNRTFNQQAKLTLTIEPAPKEDPKE